MVINGKFTQGANAWAGPINPQCGSGGGVGGATGCWSGMNPDAVIFQTLIDAPPGITYSLNIGCQSSYGQFDDCFYAYQVVRNGDEIQLQGEWLYGGGPINSGYSTNLGTFVTNGAPVTLVIRSLNPSTIRISNVSVLKQ